jgi:hypothetical protein
MKWGECKCLSIVTFQKSIHPHDNTQPQTPFVSATPSSSPVFPSKTPPSLRQYGLLLLLPPLLVTPSVSTTLSTTLRNSTRPLKRGQQAFCRP